MFDQPGLPSGEIGGDQRTARNAEHVRHYIAPVRTIEDHVADQRDRLDQRVHRQIGIACRPEGVHPSIIPDIGVIATVSPRLKLLTCRLGFTSQTNTNSCLEREFTLGVVYAGPSDGFQFGPRAKPKLRW